MVAAEPEFAACWTAGQTDGRPNSRAAAMGRALLTSGFSVHLGTGGDGTWVHVSGEVDMATSDHLRGSIELALATAGIGRLVINLAEVTFCDSMGLTVLVDALRACQGRGIELVLHGPDDRLRKTLKISGLADLFTIEP